MNETIRLLKQLETYPTFTLQTVASLLHKDRFYTKLYLNRLVKNHMIHHLQRNTYTVIDDPLIIASRITWPSYISLWAALRYHNLTDQTPHIISVMTTRSKSRKHIEFNNTTITFERIHPSTFFGFEKTKVNSYEVFIAEPEKALIDAVLLKKISVTEIYSILKEHLAELSIETLIAYILRTQNGAVAKRFGWMLDSLNCHQTTKLEKLVYKTRIPLDYTRPLIHTNDTKWGVDTNIGGRA